MYPAPQPPLSTDLLTSLSLTSTNHAENQPVHLRLPPGAEARRHHVQVNVGEYAGLLGRGCPAGVYEYVDTETNDEKAQTEGWNGKKLVINSQVCFRPTKNGFVLTNIFFYYKNCIHCKFCDVKVPTQDITWTVPEGGGGPKYSA